MKNSIDTYKKQMNRNLIFAATSGAVALNLFLSELGLYGFRTSIPLMIGSIIILIFSMTLPKREDRDFSLLKIIPMVLMGVLYFVEAVKYKIPTYLLYAFIFIIQLPAFFKKCNKNDLAEFAERFSWWIVVLGGIGLIGCFLLSPLKMNQYTGITGNPNQWGEWQVIIIASSLYLINKAGKKSHFVILLTVLSLSLSNVLFCKSRTTLGATLCILLVYGLFSLKNRKIKIKKIAALFLAIVLIIIGSYYFLTSVTPHISKLPAIKNFAIEVDGFDCGGNEDESFFLSAVERYKKGIGDGASFSSGRFEIWKTYLNEIELTGHSPDAISIYHDRPEIKLDAHNSFIQAAYQCGITGGIMLTVITFSTGMFYLVRFIKKRGHMEELSEAYYISLFLSACVYMMLSSSFGPYNSFTLIGFWLFSVGYYVNYRSDKSKK